MYPENDTQYWEDEISEVGSNNFSLKKGYSNIEMR